MGAQKQNPAEEHDSYKLRVHACTDYIIKYIHVK